ncbi:MAG: M3 family oligoendopeptidase [Candidatus Cloacimonetes bacterium]|nr:M3 family oligoendopeptidase [Candidatus Cloacimonadota bacterium]
MKITEEKISRRKRKYYSEDYNVTDWNVVEKSFQELLEMEINSGQDLVKLMEQSSELAMIISEKIANLYIKMTRYADQPEHQQNYNQFYASVVAKAQPYNNKLNLKFYESPYKKELSDEEYGHLKRMIANEIEIFREENVPLKTKEVELSNKYGEINSKMTVTYDGKEQTLAQLGKYLLEPDRKAREEVWRLRYERMNQDKEVLDDLFDEMRHLREQQAKNAGFDNYRDYKHKEMGRFAYTPEDIQQFHYSVEKVILPYLRELTEERREKLNIESVRPWDTAVDLDGKILKPFQTTEEFIGKGIKIMNKVDPEFAINLNKMDNTGLLDLENRKGKAPGGYNYPLHEMGTSFIFMNAVGLHRDVVTLLHESGHAMHSFATNKIPIIHYQDTPSEVAELASMAMEMMTMDYWTEYYPSEEDFNKAKRDQMQGTLKFLPWCMIVDAFQQWIYTNPQHTKQERAEYFASLMERFNTGVDWQGLEELKKYSWMFQLHIFEVPFYYIEYGMAQLGALAVYKNYRERGKKAVEDYKKFLALGYTKPVDQLYETAGINFDFSESNLEGLMKFVRKELEEIK